MKNNSNKDKQNNFWNSSNGQWFLLIVIFIIFGSLGELSGGWSWIGTFIISFIIWRILMILTKGDEENY